MSNIKILFIDPLFSYRCKNTSGIAFLRGYLKFHGLETAALNLNRYTDIDKSIEEKFNNFLLKSLSELNLTKHIKFCQNPIISGSRGPTAEYYRRLQKLLQHSGPKNIWQSIYKFKEFDPVFSDILKKYNSVEYLCVSVSFYQQIIPALMLAEFIKKRAGKKMKIVFGGTVITGWLEDMLELLKLDPVVDYLVVGEGETALCELIQKKEKVKIPNLIYRSQGKYIFSRKQNYYENIKELPAPIYDLCDSIFLQATRKCYWGKCEFCIYHKFSFSPLSCIKPPARVFADLLDISKRRYIDESRCQFIDACLPVSFVKEFSGLIIKHKKIKRDFICYMRFEDGFDYKTLEIARRAGFNNFIMGAESLQPRILKVINKGQTRDTILRIINDAQKLDQKLELCFVVGWPTQSREEIIRDLKGIEYLLKSYSNIINININKFEVRPGSMHHRRPEKYGLKLLSPRFFGLAIPYKFTYKNSLTHKEIDNIVWDYYDSKLNRFIDRLSIGM